MRKATIKKKLFADVTKLRAPEGYLNAGYPNFDTLFARDSLIAALQILDIGPSIARATLEALAGCQAKILDARADAQPGKIIHTDKERAFGDKIYYGSVDATPLFIILAGEYFRKAGDRDFILQIWKNVVSAALWMTTYGDEDNDHFIEYKRMLGQDGLFHQGWRDSRVPDDHLGITPSVAIVEAQGYAYMAYHAASNLAVELGASYLANRWLEKAEELRAAFHKAFWWEEESYYYLALDGSKNPKRSVSSNPGHLLFTGIVPDDVLERFVKRLFEPDLFTPYGIRTVSENDPDFDALSYHLGSIWPHDNWMIYYGLKQLGFAKEANRIKRGLVAAYGKLGHMPELYGVKDGKIVSLSGPIGANRSPNTDEIVYVNRLQAWASCGLLSMIYED